MSLTNKGKQQILREQMHAMFPYFIKINWRNGTVSRFVNTDEDMDFEEYDAETGTYNTETAVLNRGCCPKCRSENQVCPAIFPRKSP